MKARTIPAMQHIRHTPKIIPGTRRMITEYSYRLAELPKEEREEILAQLPADTREGFRADLDLLGVTE